MIDDSESKVLRAFCNLDVDKNGSLDVSKIKGPPPFPLAPSLHGIRSRLHLQRGPHTVQIASTAALVWLWLHARAFSLTS